MEEVKTTSGPVTALPDPAQIAITINGTEELPTREEFFTNYPFFKYWKNHFNDRLSDDKGINIYIHIPFCIQICDYCFYMKEQVKSKSQVDDYIDTLCREMALVSDSFHLRSRRVNSIYIGGGTPSVLTEVQFRRLIDALHRYHHIEDPEFTFEAEPGTFTAAKLNWYKESGINRISMGVQSFNDEVIAMSSRKHTGRQAIHSIQMIQDKGGFRINTDLLSGLPGDRMDTWEQSVATALEQQVDMLTIYKMKTYANTMFYKKGVQANEIRLPAAEEEIAFMNAALDRVFGAGYTTWSSFAFTRDNHLHRYAENTWRGQDLIAYGVSSFGKIGHINYQNINNIKAYAEKVSGDKMPVYRTYALTAKDQMVKELLLCAARLSSWRKKEFTEKFGFDFYDLIPDVIGQLQEKGYIVPDSAELTLTRQGILYGDFVGKVLAAALKEALGKDAIGFMYQVMPEAMQKNGV